MTYCWFLFSASNSSVNGNQNANRQATKPITLCGWSVNKQNKIKSKNFNSLVGKEQLESYCGESVWKNPKLLGRHIRLYQNYKNCKGIRYHENK